MRKSIVLHRIRLKLREDRQGSFVGIIRKNTNFADRFVRNPGGLQRVGRFSRGGLFINKNKD